MRAEKKGAPAASVVSKHALRVKKVKKPICKPKKSGLKKKKEVNKKLIGSEEEVECENKYYMNFDFYFKRTCFRTMTLYFKTVFKPFFEQWKHKRSKALPINEILLQFTRTTHPGLLESLKGSAKEYLELLKLLVFSHRHNKNDSYLSGLLVDFSVVREPMYRYSKVAQERFFEHPAFAFLFSWFATDSSAQTFAQAKFSENPDEKFAPRMSLEMVHLCGEATEHLTRSTHASSAPLVKYLQSHC